MRRPIRPFWFAFLLGATIAGRAAHAGDPTTADCLAASESSTQLENQHRLREARAQLLVCALESCPADIRTECARRFTEVNSTIPTIVFEAKDMAGTDLLAVKVTMDDQPIVDRLEGTAISIDPGVHTFRFDTVGQPPVFRQLIIREGEKDRREQITFGQAPAVVVAPPAVVVAPPPVVALPRPQEESGLGARRAWAIALAGVGVVGLGVGIGYGLASMSRHDQAQAVCPRMCPDQSGVNLWNQAAAAGNVSTAGFVVAALAFAGGAALWLTGQPNANEAGDKAPGTQVSLGLGSVQVKGVW
jgi:hypothetical protein